MDSPLDRFRDTLAAAGQPAEDISPDGRIHRYDPPSGKRGRKPCWYKLHTLPSGHFVGHYGDWRSGDKGVEFRSWENGAATPYPEASRYMAEARAASERAEQDLAAARERAAENAKTKWPKLSQMGESQYLLRKGVGAYGIKFGQDERGNYIAVPMRAGTEWRGIQSIYDSGEKAFPYGTEKTGAYAIVGHFSQNGSIYLCEGYATAATIHECSGEAVIVCFDAGNIVHVVQALLADRVRRERLVICADNDQWTERGNAGAKVAWDIECEFKARAVLPSFDGYDTADKPTDFNDLCRLAGIDEVRRQLGALKVHERLVVPTAVPKVGSLLITEEEYEHARIAPRCIVENYLYADTALLLAAGGTGKTTLQLYEAVHIVLGLPLYGFKVASPGTVLIVTAEDSRELLIARLRRIVVALGLSDVRRRAVQQGVRILDLSAQISRLVTSDRGNNLQLTPLVDNIIEACKGDEPALVALDPAIAFGAGESRINDNEQALITASRRMVRSLDCCVRYAHHLGKEAARNKILDQYAGRSGSALPDGSRMVVVLQPWTNKDSLDHSPPEIFRMTDDSQVMLMSRPKLSYAAPQGLMWINRRSYAYEYTPDFALAPGALLGQNANQIELFLISELVDERRYSQNDLLTKSEVLCMTQKSIREAVSELKVSMRVSDEPTGKTTRGGARTYLLPIEPKKSL